MESSFLNLREGIELMFFPSDRIELVDWYNQLYH